MILRLGLSLFIAIGLPAQTFLYVSSLSTNAATTISVFNTTSPARLAFTGTRAGALLVSADGRSYFATDANGSTVAAYGAGTVQALATAGTGGSPASLALAPNGQRLYVAAAGGGIVSVHDPRTFQLIGSLGAGYSPTAIIVHPDNSRFYVANASDREVAVFSANPLRVIKRLKTGGGPIALTFLDNRTLLVLNSGGESVTRIDTEGDEIQSDFAVGPEPAAMALAGAERLLVSNSGDSTIRVFNPATGRQTSTINLPPCRAPRCAVMSLAVAGNLLYAANSNQNEVYAIDLTTGRVTATFDVPVGPRWIAVGTTN